MIDPICVCYQPEAGNPKVTSLQREVLVVKVRALTGLSCRAPSKPRDVHSMQLGVSGTASQKNGCPGWSVRSKQGLARQREEQLQVLGNYRISRVQGKRWRAGGMEMGRRKMPGHGKLPITCHEVTFFTRPFLIWCHHGSDPISNPSPTPNNLLQSLSLSAALQPHLHLDLCPYSPICLECSPPTSAYGFQ